MSHIHNSKWGNWSKLKWSKDGWTRSNNTSLLKTSIVKGMMGIRALSFKGVNCLISNIAPNKFLIFMNIS